METTIVYWGLYLGFRVSGVSIVWLGLGPTDQKHVPLFVLQFGREHLNNARWSLSVDCSLFVMLASLSPFALNSLTLAY